MQKNSVNWSVLVIQGPNLNLLGSREPEVYGKATLDDIHQKLATLALEADISLEAYQSNHEGELIDRVQKAKKKMGLLTSSLIQVALLIPVLP